MHLSNWYDHLVKTNWQIRAETWQRGNVFWFHKNDISLRLSPDDVRLYNDDFGGTEVRSWKVNSRPHSTSHSTSLAALYAELITDENWIKTRKLANASGSS